MSIYQILKWLEDTVVTYGTVIGISIIYAVAVFFFVSILDLCMIIEYLFVGNAMLWPWLMAKFTKSNRKILYVLVSVVLGCALSYFLIGWSSYPECHALAYQMTYKPLYFTIGSGIVSFLIWLGYYSLSKRS